MHVFRFSYGLYMSTEKHRDMENENFIEIKAL